MQKYFQVKQVSTCFLFSCLLLLPFCIVLTELGACWDTGHHCSALGHKAIAAGQTCHTSWPLAGNCQVLCNVQLRQLWNCSYIQWCEIELLITVTNNPKYWYRKLWQILQIYSGTVNVLAEVSRIWTHVHQWVSLVMCVMCQSVTVSRLPEPLHLQLVNICKCQGSFLGRCSNVWICF